MLSWLEQELYGSSLKRDIRETGRGTAQSDKYIPAKYIRWTGGDWLQGVELLENTVN